MLEANEDDCQVFTPKAFKWDKVELPKIWVLEKVLPLRTSVSNTRLNLVLSYDDGSLKIPFPRYSEMRPSIPSVDESLNLKRMNFREETSLPRREETKERRLEHEAKKY